MCVINFRGAADRAAGTRTTCRCDIAAHKVAGGYFPRAPLSCFCATPVLRFVRQTGQSLCLNDCAYVRVPQSEYVVTDLTAGVYIVVVHGSVPAKRQCRLSTYASSKVDMRALPVADLGTYCPELR